MKEYIVAVPVYVTMTVKARTPEIAAEAGRDFVKESMLTVDAQPVGVRQNGVLVQTAVFEGLDDDDTPEVFELIDGQEVSVYPNREALGLAA